MDGGGSTGGMNDGCSNGDGLEAAVAALAGAITAGKAVHSALMGED